MMALLRGINLGISWRLRDCMVFFFMNYFLLHGKLSPRYPNLLYVEAVRYMKQNHSNKQNTTESRKMKHKGKIRSIILVITFWYPRKPWNCPPRPWTKRFEKKGHVVSGVQSILNTRHPFYLFARGFAQFQNTYRIIFSLR